MLNMKCVYCGKVTENIIDGGYGTEIIIDGDDEYVCAECLERDFTSCRVCGVWVHNDDICTVYRAGSEVCVCEQCCNNSYSHCTE